MQQVIIFGERPGPTTDPLRALFPHTSTGAAAKLIALLGVSQADYLANSSRYNTFHDGEGLLALNPARQRVQAIFTQALVQHTFPCFIFVGAEALRCAPQFYRSMQFLEARDLVFYLPHTSGVNRWYNSAENTTQARHKLRQHVAGRLGPVQHVAGPGEATAPLYGGFTGQPPTVVLQTLPRAGQGITDTEFTGLMQLWEHETSWLSSVTAIMEHPAVPILAADGRRTVDRLLHCMRANPQAASIGWSTLLAQLTGARPVPEQDRGNLPAMQRAWLKWDAERTQDL
jgi:hypothetical protein